MTVTASIDQENFRNILKRNISLPLGIGALSALIFVGLIFFLLSTLNWVDHSQRVIGNANETESRLAEGSEPPDFSGPN